ncbi:MAG TPA: flagellar biosynthesis protein FlhA [Rhodanobacteraceae bacterium]|nr:flagellar biosynthesis protein FlhA [Rhodanobacteraceae bacterium]
MTIKQWAERGAGLGRRVGLRGAGAPIIMLLLLAMVVLPLPPFLLDVLFSFNITLSLVVVLAVVYAGRPLEFSTFPTVVLGATLLRLALNIASTRVVLLRGFTGPGAAGKVIQAFGEFAIGGNFTVGLVVFAILTIINFVVVTKGATRVSEVTARFTLDSMPGKQMAIDADLGAGLLTQDQARARRREVREEADFYGAMDGASKFVRGDAIAGILVLIINIVGGLIVGILQHGMSVDAAMRTYTLLTIGDGLVAQIPSLLLSTATAVIVTRVSDSQDMGGQVVKQLFGSPRVLTIAAVVLGVMGIIPGMPNVAFLLLAGTCGGIAWMLARRQRQQPGGAVAKVKAADAAAATQKPAHPVELTWDDVTQVDAIGLEVGYRLISMVDRTQGGELLGRIKSVRRKLSQDLGFLVPTVHVRDNLDLEPDRYRILLQGVPTGEGSIQLGRMLAINPGQTRGTLDGIATRDPSFGLPAVWIEPAARSRAKALGYTVVDAPTVVATHLSHLLQAHAGELLGYQETQQLLDRLAREAPKLVADLVPKRLPLGTVAKVLQNLLADHVSIRNLRAIVESLAEHAEASQKSGALTALARVALGRQIVNEISALGKDVPVFTLASDLERILLQSVQEGGEVAVVEPDLAQRLQQKIADAAQRQEAAGEPAVLLVPTSIRPWLARFVRHAVPDLRVLSYDEVPDDREVKLVAAVG